MGKFLRLEQFLGGMQGKVCTDLGFVRIYHKPDDTSLEEIIKSSKAAYSKCEAFFGIAPSRTRIIVAYSEAEYRLEAKVSYYKGGTAAFLMPKTFVLKEIELMEKTTKWKKEDLVNVITNGFAKAFYCNLVGSWKPLWLSGGVAVYLMGKYKWTKKQFKAHFPTVKPNELLQFNYVRKTYAKQKSAFYPFGYVLTEHLVRKYGKKKLVNLLKDFSRHPKKVNFNKLFKKLYGTSIERLAKKLLEG